MAEDTAPNPLNLLQPIMDQLAELQRQFSERCQTAGKVGSSKDVIRACELPDLEEASIKRPGNKEQFRFCRVLLGLTGAASKCFDEAGEVGNPAALKEFLKALEDTTAKRVKLIKLADRSENGWDVAKFYQADSIADNSEDEKRIKSAERQAAAEKKRLNTGKTKTYSGTNVRYTLSCTHLIEFTIVTLVYTATI